MSTRIEIMLPASTQCQRIEVYFQDLEKPERSAVVSPNNAAQTVKVKLPDGAEVEDCLILVKALDARMNPVGLGHVLEDGLLKPYHPDVYRLPAEVDAELEATAVTIHGSASVEIERHEPEEPMEEVTTGPTYMGEPLSLGDELTLDEERPLDFDAEEDEDD